MNTNSKFYIKDNAIKVILKNKRPNIIVMIGLIFLILISLLVPFSVFFISQVEIGFGYVITLIIFGGTAIYFIRKLLWNFFGSEVLLIKMGVVDYYISYNLFKDQFKRMNFNEIELNFICVQNKLGYIEFKTEKNNLTTNVLVDRTFFNKLSKSIFEENPDFKF